MISDKVLINIDSKGQIFSRLFLKRKRTPKEHKALLHHFPQTSHVYNFPTFSFISFKTNNPIFMSSYQFNFAIYKMTPLYIMIPELFWDFLKKGIEITGWDMFFQTYKKSHYFRVIHFTNLPLSTCFILISTAKVGYSTSFTTITETAALKIVKK